MQKAGVSSGLFAAFRLFFVLNVPLSPNLAALAVLIFFLLIGLIMVFRAGVTQYPVILHRSTRKEITWLSQSFS
jgi:hypothetical protein